MRQGLYTVSLLQDSLAPYDGLPGRTAPGRARALGNPAMTVHDLGAGRALECPKRLSAYCVIKSIVG